MLAARRLASVASLLLLAVTQSPAGAAENGAVTVGDSFFDPETVVVEAGSTVTWTQEGNLPHSVTADDNSFDSHPGCAVGAPGCMQNGQTFSRAFTQPGLVPYYCKIHGGAGGNGMSGVVQVVNEQGVLPTTVDTMTASAGTGTISIGGSAALGGEGPIVLGQDGLGDAVGGPAATALGLDMDKLLISRPSGSSSSLLFTIKLGGMATGGIPETILYNWDINVDGGATGAGGSWSIKTMRSRASNTGNADPYAGIFTCVPGATGFSCTQATSLSEVAYDQVKNEIRMSIPLAAIGAKAGSRIEAWPRATNPFWIGPSASGAQTLTNVFDTGTHEQYLVPGPTVHLGIAPAGEPIAYTTGGSIANSGAFSGTLPAPVDPGAYDVGAKVCFGTNCGTRSVRVTL